MKATFSYSGNATDDQRNETQPIELSVRYADKADVTTFRFSDPQLASALWEVMMPWLMSEFRGTGAVSSPVEDGPSVGSGSIQNHGAQHLSEQEAIASSLGLTVSQATMIFQRCLLGESFYDVAEEFGVTIDQVIVLMKLGGMSMRWRRVGERDRQEMRRRYVDERESVKNIGEALGFSGATVGRHLVSLGVKMRGPRGRERA